MKMVDSFEKIPLEIFPNATAGSAFVAKKIAALIREKEKNKERCVLGSVHRKITVEIICRTYPYASGRRS